MRHKVIGRISFRALKPGSYIPELCQRVPAKGYFVYVYDRHLGANSIAHSRTDHNGMYSIEITITKDSEIYVKVYTPDKRFIYQSGIHDSQEFITLGSSDSAHAIINLVLPRNREFGWVELSPNELERIGLNCLLYCGQDRFTAGGAYTYGAWPQGEGQIFRYSNISWEKVYSEALNCQSILCINNEIFAAGYQGLRDWAHMLRSHDDGRNWSYIPWFSSNYIDGAFFGLWNVRNRSTNHILAVGGMSSPSGNTGIILKSTDMGDSWTRITNGVPNEVFFGIWGIGLDVYAVGTNGKVIHSKDGGDNWISLNSPTNACLRGVWGDSNNVWVVGDQGTILKSTNNEPFQIVTIPITPSTCIHFRGICGLDSTKVFAVGIFLTYIPPWTYTGGIILSYDGVNWRDESVFKYYSGRATSAFTELWGIWSPDRLHAYAVGNGIFHLDLTGS